MLQPARTEALPVPVSFRKSTRRALCKDNGKIASVFGFRMKQHINRRQGFPAGCWQLSSTLYLTDGPVTQHRLTMPPTVCCVHPAEPSRSPHSLTTHVEESPGLTRHTQEATVVKTHDHSLVPVQTVAGTHRRRYLEEATGVLQRHGGAQARDSSSLHGGPAP